MKAKRSGFTLVEILVVLAVMALLATILIPSVTSGLARARRARCLNNLKAMGGVLTAYGADHRGKMPNVGSGADYETLTEMIKGLYEDEYLESLELLACPTDTGRTPCRGADAESFTTSANCSYAYFAGYNPLKAGGDLNQWPLMCDRARGGLKAALTDADNHGAKMRNAVYLGGNTATLRTAEDANAIMKLELPAGVTVVE
ncbi:MAG: type II secretion system protein [Kiritimatiellae bacterium]|nr:type II secretion system protein [Kiritimatiellia bacterium]